MRARCAVGGAREGLTLVELLVALAMVGLLFGVSTVAVTSLQPAPESAEVVDLRTARRAAIQSGSPRTAHGVLFLPDGRAVGPGVDPLTGAAHAP
jgi:prepilin-type N-terminal cleavage/methylation domain-containing protein